MKPIHAENHKGLSIKIYNDETAENPYTSWDMFGTMHHWHRRGFFGEDLSRMEREDIQTMMNEIKGAGGIVLPVYLYEHGGQTIRTTGFSCPWDSGQVGFWSATAEEIQKEFGGDKERAARCITGEIQTMDSYLKGEVYGFVLEDEDGEHLDSCWGFYGDDENPREKYCLSEARSAVDYHASERDKKRRERIKSMIRNHVPLDARMKELTA